MGRSQRSRDNTIVCRALLARRSPPRLTQGSAGCLAVQTLGVVAGRDEQRGGGVGADPVALQQGRCVPGKDGGDLLIQIVDLGGQLENAAAQ